MGFNLAFKGLISALGVGVWSAPLPGRFTPEKDAVSITHEAVWAPERVCTGTEYFAPIGIRSPDRLARSESLYRLSYPGPHWFRTVFSNGVQLSEY